MLRQPPFHSEFLAAAPARGIHRMSVVLPTDDFFSPIRLPQGTTNAVLHLQAFFSTQLPPKLKEHFTL